jgi:hypothetical protein
MAVKCFVTNSIQSITRKQKDKNIMLSKPLYIIDNCKIFGNNIPRDIISGYELSKSERDNFDYYHFKDELDCASFFRYKGNVYDLGEFMRCDSHFGGKFDGYTNDTFFSGILVKYCNDNEQVKVYTFYS